MASAVGADRFWLIHLSCHESELYERRAVRHWCAALFVFCQKMLISLGSFPDQSFQYGEKENLQIWSEAGFSDGVAGFATTGENEMNKLNELLDYLNELPELEMKSNTMDIAVEKAKLHDLVVEIELLLKIRLARAPRP